MTIFLIALFLLAGVGLVISIWKVDRDIRLHEEALLVLRARKRGLD